MPGYPLQALLRARRFREEAAARETARARILLDEARVREQAAREALRRHRDWRPLEEERLFGAVRGRSLSQEELAAYRQDVQSLRHRELALQEAIREAENTVSIRVAEVDAAKKRQAEAVRDRQKIETHRDLWRRDEMRRIEAAEGAELEDFTVVSVADEEFPCP